jgi:hypothetical protein
VFFFWEWFLFNFFSGFTYKSVCGDGELLGTVEPFSGDPNYSNHSAIPAMPSSLHLLGRAGQGVAGGMIYHDNGIGISLMKVHLHAGAGHQSIGSVVA